MEDMDFMVESQIISRGITDQSVIRAMKTVNRSLFVRDTDKQYSFHDTPLPIGYGQTISQPYIVAYMTELLNLGNDDIVLEIGTGSGYQSAVLSSIVSKLYSVETIKDLADTAITRLNMAGYNNIHIKTDDGFNGWIEKSPFDAIIVAAAATEIPEPLLNQLNNNGRMIIPVGKPNCTQYLKLITKTKEKIDIQSLIPVRFVPFVTTKMNTDYR